MTRKPPAPPPNTPPEGGAAATLAALEHALSRADLPADTRVLLQQARDSLATTMAECDAERQRYRTLFDAVPDPVSIIAWDGTVLDLNRAGMEAYQRTREEIVGQPIETLNPDLPTDHMVPVWETLNRGGTYVVEVTNMRGDGTRFPVEVHTAGLNYEGHKAMVAVARDLSSRHTAELRYRELMEAVDRGIIVQDEEQQIVYANVAAMKIFGIGQDESINDALRPDHWMVVDERGHALPPERYPSYRAMQTGRIIESTEVGLYHRAREQLMWLSCTSVPQFPAGGDKPHQVLTLFSDVTTLKRDSTLFDRAQAMAHIGGWEWNVGPDRLYLTHEAQRILGHRPAPANIEGMLQCLRAGDRDRLRAALGQSISFGRNLDLEVQGHRADGRSFWVRVIGEAEAGDPLNSRLTGTLQDITERKHDEETLRVQARSDPLTGLLNRDAVLAELESRLDDPLRSQLAVLYVDLDRFKVVNDVLGHAAGDRLLASAARRIQRAIGSEGLIARFGGDEFLVICDTGSDPSRPERLADAILEIFGDSFRLDGEEFSITASIGIAQAPLDGVRSQQLIQSADVAMYDSKRRGRNGWQGFTPELAEQQLHRLQLETHLRRAVNNDEFHLVYQPQVDMRNGDVMAVEALIRWRNHSLGEIRPDKFIDHAETTGDIVGIGDWVLHEACRQMREWQEGGLKVPRIAVNVSYRQFLGEDLASTVAAVLAEYGLPGHALELEFTERVLIEDAPDTLRTFAALREMGVMLTIDDFGEGYSALNYLRRLPIHGLKLSQLFVQGVPDNQSDVAVCQAVTGIAKSLGLELVAEGVEAEHHRSFLLQLGIHVGQGFLFAPGLTPAELRNAYRTASMGA
ncbi:bifunctional diguanylate cyclase/phosphodiesterase [Lysobacter sp. LF1]|uniref:Bifunctional diguanylate cyclase/phosphodiesterase n=1 Tax=Lysobacter stagni TaxID=3045172 RepID=A0ABT6XH86_9GAMM|nr:EAL domain-containing protein [Lysobacter sp. LF1]MDI9239520.1 bifunctional diguanylate cyclase/phosphodiesterase [Lysobacter sp. LF1]